MKTMNRISTNLIGLCIMIAMLFSFQSKALAQDENEKVIVLRGKLTDQNTKKPVVFANVYVTGTNIGTVSNSEGEFIIKVPNGSQSRTISVSYMGYKTVIIPVNNLKSTENTITLEPEPLTLKELIVRTNDPVSLIRGAIRNVPQNYGVDPFLCTAFYREAIMQNRLYVGVAEAVLDIYKSRYSSENEIDRVKIFKGRKSQDVKKMDTLVFKLQGGHQVALLLDLAKNPQSFMTEETFSEYDYKPVTIANIEGKDTYILEFTQKKGIEEPYYDGKIYLDVNTLAIKRVEFGLSPEGVVFADKYLVKKKPTGTNVKTQSGVYVVDYRELNGRWTLNHVRYEVKFKVDKKRQLFNKIYTSTVDLAVTSKDTVNVSRFKYTESLKPNQIFIEQLDGGYDENFWGSYNIIKPEEPIEEAVERINKKMKKYQNI